MMNKAINTLVLATVDSLTKFKNKLAYYLAIFAMVFGSTFGTLNSAYADDGDIIDIGTGLDIDADAVDTNNGGARAISTGNFDVIIDAENDLVTGTSIGIDKITTEDDDTADIFNVLLDGATLTVDETVTSRDDTLTINIGDGILVSELNIVGAATGADAGDLIIESTAASTLTLSGGVADGAIAHSATIKGAGTLKVTGVVTNDETIGFGVGAEIGILDIDGTLTSTSTIESLVLDLDGTLAGATSLINTNASTLNGSITTTGVTTLTGAVTLDGNTDITTTDEIIMFGSTVNGDGIDLTLDSGTAAVNFDGIVGGAVGGGVGDIAITGALDLDAAITDAETISVSLASNLGASITTTATTGTSITLSDAATLSAAVTLTTANTNISLEEVNGANTLTLVAGTGTITTSAAMTQVTTMTVTSASTASFAATTNATSTVLNSTGTNTFTGILTSPTVDINAGTTTFQGKVTASTKIDVAGASTIVNIDSAPDTANLTVAAGVVNISVQDVDIDDLDLNSGDIVIEKTVTNGQTVFLAATQGDTLVGTGEIYMPVNLSNGQTLVLFEDTDGTAVGALEEADVEGVVVDTALTNYVASETATNVVLTSTDKSSSTTASELSVTENDAKALLQLRNAAISDANADGDAEDAVFNALNAKGGFSATEDTNLAKQAAPQTDMISGSTFATKAMTGSLQGIMSNRMASLRSGDAFMTGMSAGNGMSANSGFIQAFGTEAEQKNKTVGSGTQFGYDASSAGLALGFDGITDNGSVVGLSFSMSNTDVDGKGTGNSKNDIDSYTVSVYADKTTDAGYIEGSLTVGLNENNSSRIVNTAGLDRTYKGDYDSEQVSLKIGGGMPNAVGTGFVTPYGSVTATRITTDAYTETSTTAGDNLRLRVAQDDVDSIVGTVGLKYHTVLDNGGTPMISLAINNEFGDNTINSTNTYQGGGTAFTTSTDVEELSATLGLGYSFRSDNTTLELAYEADANDDDYLGHYGSIKIVSKF